MMKKSIVIVCAMTLFFGVSAVANALTIDITLDTNPPPISSSLSEYITDIKAKQIEYTGIPLSLVGFDGADVGDGAGNGIDEIVAFSFSFSPFTSISSATLTFNLTKPYKQDTSDHIYFADNSSIHYPESNSKFYGNNVLGYLAPNSFYTVTLDLTNLGTNIGFIGVFGNEDLSNLLLDGDLDVVYHDDAFIHSARLQIEGTPVPEPTTMLLLGSGLIGLVAFRKKLKK